MLKREVPVTNSCAVLLVDDGELDDVQQILKSLEIDFERTKGGSSAQDVSPPTDLLIATPRRIDDIEYRGDDLEPDPPTRIVVVSEDSPSLRAQLRAVGFDYLVRRPVHHEALRLLIAHCVYRGAERRVEPRIPVGFEISFRTGVLSRRATLADLSTRGCRLLSPYPLDAGNRICVKLPEALGATEALAVEGVILRNHFDEQLGLDGLYAAAVEFEDMSPKIRNELEWILEDKIEGPPTLTSSTRGRETNDGGTPRKPQASEPKRQASRPGKRRRRGFLERNAADCSADPRTEDSSADAGDSLETGSEDFSSAQLTLDVDIRISPEPIDPIAEHEPPAERRSADRRAYTARVPAFGTRALRVLVGRDLSVGGMRIEYNSSLELGDRLHLAIYGSPGDEPFLVWGTLNRVDLERGMGIEFDEVHPVVAEQLERMLGSLPSVESLHDDEIAAMGTVLTEVLDR
jgi:hypothetical protein